LRAAWTVAPFTVRAIAGYTYNLDKQARGDAAFLGPTAAFLARAGLQVRLTRSYAIELDYVGDGIRFEHAWRVAHGAVMGFSRSF